MTTTNSHVLVPFFQDFGDTTDDVVQPTLEEHPFLQYMKGTLSTLDRKVPVGWHVRVGVNPELDRHLAQRGAEQYTVQHKSGEVRQVPYWNLHMNGQPCSLIIVAHGVKSPWQMKKDVQDRFGVAYGVGVARDEEGNILYRENSDQPRQRPQVQFRAFVHELLGTNEHPEDGFNEWFQVHLSNYIIDDLFKVFNAQYPVIEAYNASIDAENAKRQQRGEQEIKSRAKFWSFSIPTIPSSEGRDVGGEKQSTIYPMVHQVPFLRPGTPETMAYLDSHRIPRHIQQRLLAGLLDETLTWSIQRSIEIVNGKQEPLALGTTVTEVSDAPARELPQLPAALDPPIDADQMHWIRTTYCGNNPSTMNAVCQHFNVTDLAQLRLSQYTLLSNQLQK